MIKRMLSPLLLRFGRDQVIWDCNTISACEALPDGLPLTCIACGEDDVPVKAWREHTTSCAAIWDRHWRQLLQEAEITVKAAMSSLEKFWERFIYTHTSCKLTEQFYKDDDMWDIGRLMRDILGKANFDFEKSYLGRLRTEDFSGGKKQLETVAKKSSNAKENCGNGQMGNGWKLDEPSKLNSEKFAIQ
ncbi:heterokaryon incompatibility protein (TOL) [Colletotrichum truncatum]|uniref:Heterokaryon incompatibility protein (TOL) n=1 Tax=Colletotrichum truncatum TaxID=5467 RepID=A0ACC3YC13_COLTU